MDSQPFTIDRIYGIAGSALNAQTIRMNTIASNLANVGTESSTNADAYRAKRTVFSALLKQEQLNAGNQWIGGVKVEEIVDDQTPVIVRYDPASPKANEEGYVFLSNVSPALEMVDMLEAARSYENNIEAINTAKQLMQRTLDVLRS